MRLPLVEDDPLLGDALRAGLHQHGFQVDWVRDGVVALQEIRTKAHAAVVLDLTLPGLDGLSVLSQARDQGVDTPILVLTARDAVPDRVRGLNLGADDYVAKPVDLDELAARLRALVRRAHGLPQEQLRHGPIALDPAARRATVHGREVTLSTREFDLLEALMLVNGRVLSRDQLQERLYGWGQEVDSNAIEVHVHHLRRKLGQGLIETIRGVGYTLARRTPETLA